MKKRTRQAKPGPAPDVQTFERPSSATFAGWAHRIRRAIPGDYRVEIGPDPNRPGLLLGQVVHAPGPVGVAATRWPHDGHPDVDDLRRQLEGRSEVTNAA